ncbi:proteasome inhibitor PI31 subunit-like, partial [Limulus polyphemus]|uniref:Proteasome inhibitor PI31 subunit-like n=1 Tax=Limulus polyphemus TaxID=6850 RepID=A0ABM1C2R1_LIMPO
MEKEKAGGILVKTDDYVTDSFRDFKSAFQDIDTLEDRFKKEVLSEVNKPTASSSSKQGTSSTSEERKSDKKVNKPKSTLEDDDPLRIPGTERRPLTDWMTDRDPFGVGRGDLDPFGGGVGGGMLMDPSRFRTPGGPFGPPPISSGFPGRLPRFVFLIN